MADSNSVTGSIQAAANAGHLSPISSQTILANLNATTVPSTIGDQISKLETAIPIALNLVIDSTGSLVGYETIMVNAINNTLADFVKMRDKTGQEIYVRITVFNERSGVDNVRILQDFIHVQDCPQLASSDYAPHGMTPLFEAMYDGITATSVFGASAFTYGATGVQEITIIISDGFNNVHTRSESDVKRFLVELNTKAHFTCAFVGIGDEADFRAVALSAGVFPGNILTVDKTDTGITKALKLISSSVGSKSQSLQTGQSQTNSAFF